MKDFFISYNWHDKSWAEWIAQTLKNAGYTVMIQSSDMLPGSNFVLEMQRATVECERTVAVLSADWLASSFTQPEWAAAFASDPTGAKRKLIPVRVRACQPAGILATIVYCDLVGLNDTDASSALINAVKGGNPPETIEFPGYKQQSTVPRETKELLSKEYPGSDSTVNINNLSLLTKCAFDLLSYLRTTRITFEAQSKLRDELVREMQWRLVVNPYEHYEYEKFFARYFSELNKDEKRTFDTIRAFTKDILQDYNRRMLNTIENCPGLSKHIPSITDLTIHLRLWLSKFDGVFLNSPEMCLLFVGVEEGVPFPDKVEMETWQFLKQQEEKDEILNKEPKPQREFEEHSDDQYWRLALRHRWWVKEINEAKQKREQILAGSNYEVNKLSQADKRMLKELDERLAAVFRDILYPGIFLDGIEDFDLILLPLQELVNSQDKTFPVEFRQALAESKTVLVKSTLYDKLNALLPILPTITFYVDELELTNDLSKNWRIVLEKFADWAVRSYDESRKVGN